MNKNQNSFPTTEQLVGKSIAEMSELLSIPGNTIRKYITDFGLETSKQGRKIVLTQAGAESLLQILKLKSNGLSIRRIKGLLSAATSGEAPAAEAPTKATEPPAQPQPTKPTATQLEESLVTAGQQREAKSQEKPKEIGDGANGSEPFAKLTRESVNDEIGTQSKRAARLKRFLAGRSIPKRERAEVEAELNRRVVFLAGLRHLRDNWLTRPTNKDHEAAELTAGVSS